MPQKAGRKLFRRTFTVCAVAAIASTGCTPPPTAGPHLATGAGAVNEGTSSPASEAPARPPQWSAPQSDVRWAPCSKAPPQAPSIRLDCATLPSFVNPGGDRLGVPIARVRTESTPPKAPPLVVIAGAEDTATSTALRLAQTSASLAATHPLVVVEHRGLSGPAGNCLDRNGSRALATLADRGVDPTSSAVRAALASTAQNCTDALSGGALRFGASGVADDIERLRSVWRAPGLALLALGSGSSAVLDYATTHPTSVSAVVLDSPPPLSGRQEDHARAQLDGSEAALRQWTAQCTRPECGRGSPADGADRLSGLLTTAGQPGAQVPSATLAEILRSALGDLAGASERGPSAADALLGEVLQAAPALAPSVIRRAADLPSSLGYIAECTDLDRRVPVNRIPELDTEFAHASSAFGHVLASNLARCSTWPTPEVRSVALAPSIPVMLLASAADPDAGVMTVQSRAGELTASGARALRTVNWQAPGSRALLHSECARTALLDFLTTVSQSNRIGEPLSCPS